MYCKEWKEAAIEAALDELGVELEIDQEIPPSVADKATEILYEWQEEENIRRTDELHSQSINNHIARSL